MRLKDADRYRDYLDEIALEFWRRHGHQAQEHNDLDTLKVSCLYYYIMAHIDAVREVTFSAFCLPYGWFKGWWHHVEKIPPEKNPLVMEAQCAGIKRAKADNRHIARLALSCWDKYKIARIGVIGPGSIAPEDMTSKHRAIARKIWLAAFRYGYWWMMDNWSRTTDEFDVVYKATYHGFKGYSRGRRLDDMHTNYLYFVEGFKAGKSQEPWRE